MRLDFTDTLTSQECVECGVTFALTSTMERHLRETKRVFRCPNGHAQAYTGPTEAERLRSEVESLQKTITRKTEIIEELRTLRDSQLRSMQSLRGTITRMKKARK